MSAEPTLYDVLGIAPTATRMEIRTAYRLLAKQLHPDMGGSSREFDAVTEAYHLLSDPSQRARYDQTLRPVGGPRVSLDPVPALYEPPVAYREQPSGDEHPDFDVGRWRGAFGQRWSRAYTIVLAVVVAAAVGYVVSAIANVPDYTSTTADTAQLSCGETSNVAVSFVYASKALPSGQREWWPRVTVVNGSALAVIVEVNSSGSARLPNGNLTATSAWTLDTQRIAAGVEDTEDSVPDHSNPLIAPAGSTLTQSLEATVYGGDSKTGYLPQEGCPRPIPMGR